MRGCCLRKWGLEVAGWRVILTDCDARREGERRDREITKVLTGCFTGYKIASWGSDGSGISGDGLV